MRLKHFIPCGAVIIITLVVTIVYRIWSYEPNPDGWIAEAKTVDIGNDNPVEVRFSNVRNNFAVGIRCSPQVWNSLLSNAPSLSVALLETNKYPAQISDIDPGKIGTYCDEVPGARYLFSISAERGVHFKLSVKGISNQIGPAQIILAKSPAFAP